MSKTINEKIEQGREYRNMPSVVQTTNDESYIVEGYATTFNQPYHLYYTEDRHGQKIEVKEQIDSHAFDNADMSDVILQFDHEGKVYARMSNHTLELEPNEKGLFVRANLSGTQSGRDLYEEIKGGYINKMSFGFTVADDSITEADGGYLRTVKSVGKLFDVSAVSIPANDFTMISSRNRCDGVIAEIETERANLEEERRAKAEQKENLLSKLNALKGESNEH